MKFVFCWMCFLFAACKHHPVVIPQTTKIETVGADTLQMIAFDYSIDTLNCDTAHFRNIYNDYEAILGVSPRPQGKIFNFCLNTQNENEIFYIKDSYILMAYNFITETEREVRKLPGNYEVYSNFTPNGWLLLSGHHKIGKVKINGDSLGFLLVDKVNYKPTWNSVGSKIAFRTEYEDSHFFILDSSGRISDTIYGEPGYYFDWSKKDVFARQRENGSIAELNMVTRTRKILVPSIGAPRGFCWLGDYKTMAVATMNGLYIANTETQQYRKIKCTAHYNSWYLQISYSRKHRRLLALKLQKLTPYVSKVFLVSMNIDGSDEKIVVQ